MNIYMYTVYTYLSVDIYECMSNVSITCSFCRFVSRPLYIMIYIRICIRHSFCLTLICTLVQYNVHVIFFPHHNCAYDIRVFPG